MKVTIAIAMLIQIQYGSIAIFKSWYL